MTGESHQRSSEQTTSELANRVYAPVALVTGSAAPRVGQGIAKHLATAGYRLAIHAHRSHDEGIHFVTELRQAGTEAILVDGPVEVPETMDRWLEAIDGHFGRLDAVVHSAAIWDRTPLETMSLESIEKHWRINQLGPMLICQRLGLYMAKQATGGAIVLIGDWAIDRPYADFAAYFASKGALPTITRTFAVELAHRNPRLRVNAILPGPVLMHEGIEPETRKRIAEQSLVQREGTPKDVAVACQFLMEQPFVTGVCLPVDGGRSASGCFSNDDIAHPGLQGIISRRNESGKASKNP